MTVLPVLLDGASVEALVVGGGAVAERKVRALLDVQANVRVVAPRVALALRELAADTQSLVLLERAYRTGDVEDATLVVAATDRREVNAMVAADARALRRLVIVVDAPDEGTCTMMAVHRVDPLVIGVSAGRVPEAAARIRDAVGQRFDARYADAIRSLSELRQRLLSTAGRERWRAAGRHLIAEDFCDRVESSRFGEQVAAWR